MENKINNFSLKKDLNMLKTMKSQIIKFDKTEISDMFCINIDFQEENNDGPHTTTYIYQNNQHKRDEDFDKLRQILEYYE